MEQNEISINNEITDFDRTLIEKCEALSRWDRGLVSLCARLADTPAAKGKLLDMAVEKKYEAKESL